MNEKIIEVKVKVRSSKNEVEKISESSYLVKLKASPVENQANKMLVKIMADYFDLSKSQIVIKSGQKSKNKLLIIYG